MRFSIGYGGVGMSWRSKVEEELAELSSRVSKLAHFIDVGNAAKLSEVQRVLLDVQLSAMVQYQNALEWRLSGDY